MKSTSVKRYHVAHAEDNIGVKHAQTDYRSFQISLREMPGKELGSDIQFW